MKPVKKGHAAETNLRSNQSFFSCGIGLAAFQKMCAILNLPAPSGKNGQNETLKKLFTASLEAVDKSMAQSAHNVKEFLQKNQEASSTKDIETDVFDCSVSVDGWDLAKTLRFFINAWCCLCYVK